MAHLIRLTIKTDTILLQMTKQHLRKFSTMRIQQHKKKSEKKTSSPSTIMWIESKATLTFSKRNKASIPVILTLVQQKIATQK